MFRNLTGPSFKVVYISLVLFQLFVSSLDGRESLNEVMIRGGGFQNLEMKLVQRIIFFCAATKVHQIYISVWEKYFSGPLCYNQ